MDYWKKQNIDTFLNELAKYYLDCSNQHFNGIYFPTTLNKEELEYLNSHLSLGGIVGVDDNKIFDILFKDNSKDNFLFYIIRSHELRYELTHYVTNESTVFIELAKKYLNADKYFPQSLFTDLFIRGYKIKNEDSRFVRNLYKEIKKESDLIKWCILRFAVLLDNAKSFELALAKERELFAIYSFKRGKPIYFNFPNLLGIANNAIQHYRESGDLILKAISIFGQTETIQRLDAKKGTFKRKRSEYTDNKPLQDKEFEQIAKIIFHELDIHR